MHHLPACSSSLKLNVFATFGFAFRQKFGKQQGGVHTAINSRMSLHKLTFQYFFVLILLFPLPLIF